MWIVYPLFVMVVIAGGIYFWRNIRPEINTHRNLSLLGKEAPTLTQAGITFRDLNKNGRLDPYEDPRRSIEERLEDLLRQMTLEEKAGMLFQTMIGMNKDGTILEKTGMFLYRKPDMIARRLMNHLTSWKARTRVTWRSGTIVSRKWQSRHGWESPSQSRRTRATPSQIILWRA
jgi:beta-glucosidase